MMTANECLAQLETLVLSQDSGALALAEMYLEDLLQSSTEDRSAAALYLGEVQAQLLRRTAPSPLRADISDLLSVKIVRLLEPESDLDTEPGTPATSN